VIGQLLCHTGEEIVEDWLTAPRWWSADRRRDVIWVIAGPIGECAETRPVDPVISGFVVDGSRKVGKRRRRSGARGLEEEIRADGGKEPLQHGERGIDGTRLDASDRAGRNTRELGERVRAQTGR